MLLVRSARPDRAGILAAVSRIDRDHDAARSSASIRGTARGPRCMRRSARLRRAAIALEQRHQRIERIERIQVEHQPMPELRDRRQLEHLRVDVGPQVEHDAQHAVDRPPEAHAAMYGSTAVDLRGELRELRGELDAFEVEHEAVGVAQRRRAGARSASGPSRMTRVYSCAGQTRVDATLGAANAARSARRGGRHEQPLERTPPLERNASARRAGRRARVRHRSPPRLSDATACEPPAGAHRAGRVSVIARSGVRQDVPPRARAIRPGTRCRGRNASAKPASSHSRASSKR